MPSQIVMILECQAAEQGLSPQGNRESREVFEQEGTWADLRQVWEFKWRPGGDRGCDPDGRKGDLSRHWVGRGEVLGRVGRTWGPTDRLWGVRGREEMRLMLGSLSQRRGAMVELSLR